MQLICQWAKKNQTNCWPILFGNWQRHGQRGRHAERVQCAGSIWPAAVRLKCPWRKMFLIIVLAFLFSSPTHCFCHIFVISGKFYIYYLLGLLFLSHFVNKCDNLNILICICFSPLSFSLFRSPSPRMASTFIYRFAKCHSSVSNISCCCCCCYSC